MERSRAGKEPKRSHDLIKYNRGLGVYSSLMRLDLLDREARSSLSPRLLPRAKFTEIFTESEQF